MEVQALGEDLAWKVIKLWMESEGRDLNNYQWRVVANAISECSLPIFLKLVSNKGENKLIYLCSISQNQEPGVKFEITQGVC